MTRIMTGLMDAVKCLCERRVNKETGMRFMWKSQLVYCRVSALSQHKTKSVAPYCHWPRVKNRSVSPLGVLHVVHYASRRAGLITPSFLLSS
jgi:hypothetical protein